MSILTSRAQMIKKKYVYWQDKEMWLGYFEEYRDYMTQGETLKELQENLIDYCYPVGAKMNIFYDDFA